MAQVVLTVQGLELAIALMEKFDLDRSQDLMESVGRTMRLQNARRFAQEVDPDGAPWRPLAPSTIARKGSSGILKDTGALGAFSVTASRLEARVGSKPFYAPFHQYGGSRAGWPNGCPPKRTFLGINDQDVKQIEQVVQAWFSSLGAG
jgi:phage virion morphogenesis protein